MNASFKILANCTKVLCAAGLLISGSAKAQDSWSAVNPTSGPLYGTKLAVSADGTLGIGTFVASGDRSQSAPGSDFPHRRHQNIGVIFSVDKGTTWTERKTLSDDSVLNHEVNIVGGVSNEFSISWNSGDVMSGHRLHTALTPDGGLTFTSQTQTQDLGSLKEGFLFPTLVKGDGYEMMGITGFRQDVATKPNRGSILRRSGNTGTWDTREIDLPASSSTEDTLFNGAIAASGPQTMLAYLHGSEGYSGGRTHAVEIMSSADEGLNWSRNESVTTFTISNGPILLGTDGNGTWVLVWREKYNGSYAHIQYSTDFGATWSTPESILGSGYGGGGILMDMATDRNGRWTILLGLGSYTFSEDNGQSWSWSLNHANSLKPYQIEYIGNGVWGALAYGYVGNSKPNFYTMQWGPSAVKDWQLY